MSVLSGIFARQSRKQLQNEVARLRARKDHWKTQAEFYRIQRNQFLSELKELKNQMGTAC